MSFSFHLVLWSVIGCSKEGDGPAHWRDQPLVSLDGTHDGQAFTIQLPKGSEADASDDTFGVELTYHTGGRVFAPRVTVRSTTKDTLEAALAGDSDVKGPADVLFREETATGWVYAKALDAERYAIVGETFVGEKALRCSAQLYPMRKGEAAKADIPRVARMCQSLAPR